MATEVSYDQIQMYHPQVSVIADTYFRFGRFIKSITDSIRRPLAFGSLFASRPLVISSSVRN